MRLTVKCIAYHKGQYYFGSKIQMPPLPQEVLREITSTPTHYFPLPSEFVVRKPQFVMPTMGRVWMYFRNLGMFPCADGNGQYRKFTALIEVWTERGDDGHVDYGLTGYAEVSADDAQKYIEEMNDGEYPPIIARDGEWIA